MTSDYLGALPVHRPGRLRFFCGVMSQGKSGLALQMAYNYRSAGIPGTLLVSNGRSGSGVLSSRLGIRADAVEFAPEADMAGLLGPLISGPGFVIIDEAQFLSPRQVDQLAGLADDRRVAVDCFGLTTDFTSHLFPGSLRLIELADELIPLQLEVFCWCGQRARQNARVVDGHVARTGAVVAVGDVTGGGEGGSTEYRALCRRHWRAGDLGPSI